MLQLINITKSFDVTLPPTINNFSLMLNKGDFCTVIGANGSGKSTLLKLISGDYTPESGQILFNGGAIKAQNITQVGQDVNKGTIPEMTLLENMALSHMRCNGTKLAFYNRLRATIIQKLKTLGIGMEAALDLPLSALSGGQRQMIATLMALQANIHASPQILLLDEHTSALDPNMQDILMQYTATAIKENGATTLMITHKMDDALRYGNRLIMIHQGQIVFDVAGADKEALSVSTLLNLFHAYEDKTLAGEPSHSYENKTLAGESA